MAFTDMDDDDVDDVDVIEEPARRGGLFSKTVTVSVAVLAAGSLCCVGSVVLNLLYAFLP